MKRVLSQALKELNQFRRDRLTVALAFVLPLAVLLIYGFAIRLEAKNMDLPEFPWYPLDVVVAM